MIERDFFGLDGKPTLGGAGNAALHFRYDDEGNLIEATTLGIDGKPVLAAAGIATFRQAFDGRHNRIRISYYGADGEPVLSKEVLARATDAYDTRDNAIETAYFDLDGKPTLGFGGFAGFRQAFDARNNLVTKVFFGLDGSYNADGGYANFTGPMMAAASDEESYFGADGKPAHSDGVVTIKYTYDDLGRQSKVTYLDARGHEMHMDSWCNVLYPGAMARRPGSCGAIISSRTTVRAIVKQIEGLTTSGNFPFRTVAVRRGSQIITVQVERGNLGTYIALARVSEPAAFAAPAQPPVPSR